MVLGRWKPATDRVGERLARPLAALGVTANMVSLAAVLAAVPGTWLLARGEAWAGGAVFGTVLLLDMVDGAVARVRGQATAFGAVLDATLDRWTEGLLVLGVAMLVDTLGGWVLASLALVFGSAVSYVRAKADLEAHGARRRAPPASSWRRHMFERTERMLLLLAGVAGAALDPGADPAWPAVALALYVAGSFLTVGERLWAARAALR